MVTDPNIILSGNRMAAPRLPDVNAMMQTRTAGMENIYDIEQQRAEQAKTAQKEQEAALVEALTPAYAIAFKGGGTKEALTAAFGVLSPEFQAAIKPQFDKIMALPSDNLRMSALETSLVGSEPGRAIYASIPTENQRINAEIQRGQLRVAEKKLAIDESQVGMPKPMTAAEQANIELDERRVRIAEENAAREAAKAEAIASGERGPTEPQKGEVWNPEAGRYDVVPGTKLYRESSAKHATDYKAKTAVQDRVTESLAKIDYVLSDKNKDGFGYNFGGYTEAYVGQYVPGQAQDVKNTIESLKADITQAGLELMRAGGSIGAITEREWPLLEKQIAAVTPYVSEKRARELLDNVAQRLKNIQTRTTETYDTQWGETQFYTPSEALPPGGGGGGAGGGAGGGIREGATATNPQTGERIIYRNGKWQPL
jgi:hypothetical protein